MKVYIHVIVSAILFKQHCWEPDKVFCSCGTWRHKVLQTERQQGGSQACEKIIKDTDSSMFLKWPIYTQLQKKPTSHFWGNYG